MPNEKAGFFPAFFFWRDVHRPAGLEKRGSHTNIGFNGAPDRNRQAGMFKSAAVVALTKD
ncbi:MAG TPA: hypothetical protein DEQ45_06930 [Agrobacterium sp.]|nr:hypothetical protein CFBP6625_14305 [Agrobacterium tumefaciens]HCD83553.1 hypothetical protein [Agrobacterium sp.]